MFIRTRNIGDADVLCLHQSTFCPADDATADVAEAPIAGFARATQS
jgi:hypothetical protein